MRKCEKEFENLKEEFKKLWVKFDKTEDMDDCLKCVHKMDEIMNNDYTREYLTECFLEEMGV